MLKRKEIISWLQEILHLYLWEMFWWFLPLSAIFLLPVGSLALEILLRIGLYEAVILTQLLMLFSIVYGPACGILVLLLIDSAELPFSTTYKIKWLARISVFAPILFLLTMFWIVQYLYK